MKTLIMSLLTCALLSVSSFAQLVDAPPPGRYALAPFTTYYTEPIDIVVDGVPYTAPVAISPGSFGGPSYIEFNEAENWWALQMNVQLEFLDFDPAHVTFAGSGPLLEEDDFGILAAAQKKKKVPNPLPITLLLQDIAESVTKWAREASEWLKEHVRFEIKGREEGDPPGVEAGIKVSMNNEDPPLNLEFVPVPEPSTYGLIGGGLVLALMAWRTRGRWKKSVVPSPSATS